MPPNDAALARIETAIAALSTKVEDLALKVAVQGTWASRVERLEQGFEKLRIDQVTQWRRFSYAVMSVIAGLVSTWVVYKVSRP